ncbi:extensin family protein [Rhodovulum sp. BSW8]|uniref:extensin-like domain-containing protein n=1 Tax=Rhodovulum sp. BSW8 TaxID=2259645 RepID=UPI001FB29F8A|nr:extensin family protein [Rhodovulum sp. BSW8]
MRRAGLGLALVLIAGTGSAATLDSVLRPKPRPAATQAATRTDAATVAMAEGPAALGRTLAPARPQPRPEGDAELPLAGAEPDPAPDLALRPHSRPTVAGAPVRVREVTADLTLDRSARPEPRPRTPYQVASLSAAGIRTQPSAILTPRGGVVCGDPAITGQMIAPIPGRIAGCGVDRPVRVTAVDGVALSQAATIDCDTARALRVWVSDGIKPAVGRLGGGVASLKVFAHYACRPRNNQKGAKVSEHGRGHAVDIGAVTLRNGVSMTVARGWNDAAQGKILRRIHRAACGPFGTVLGPGSDGFHKDHIHVDTARYRSGSYCR